LWGNHETYYIWNDSKFINAGYRPTMKDALRKIFNDNRSLFHCAYEIHSKEQKYLWSHAGVHQNWFNKYMIYNKEDENTHCLKHFTNFKLAEKLNMLFNQKRYEPLFYIDPERCGYKSEGGLLWCGKKRMLNNPLNGYTLIFGHSACKNGVEEHIINDNKIIIVDYPEHPFYEFEIDDDFVEYK
jgi:hypothetical protein